MKPPLSPFALPLIAGLLLSVPALQAGEMRFEYAVVQDRHASARAFHSDAQGLSVRLRQPAHVYILAEREGGLEVVYPAAPRPRPGAALRPLELIHLAKDPAARSLLLVVSESPVDELERALAEEAPVPFTWLVEALAPPSGTLERRQERGGVSVRYEGKKEGAAVLVEHVTLPLRSRTRS